MLVLFLDMDGVLNNAKFIYSRKSRRDEPFDEIERNFVKDVPDGESAEYYVHWLRAIDKKKVLLLNDIIAATQAKVVISSSWRRAWDHQEMSRFLTAMGFVGEIIDSTPTDTYTRMADGIKCERGHEIQEWLDAHPEVLRFVILDDNSDMAHLKDRFVKTTWERGLTRTAVKKATKLLLA